MSIRDTIRRLALLILLVIPVYTAGAEPIIPSGTGLTHDCMKRAARLGHHPVEALYTILHVEGGKLGTRVCYPATAKHTASCDLGPFQINSATIRAIAPRLGLDPASLDRDAERDGCRAALLAAYILREKITAAHGDVLRGLGDYNSAVEPYHHAYLARLRETYGRLFGGTP